MIQYAYMRNSLNVDTRDLTFSEGLKFDHQNRDNRFLLSPSFTIPVTMTL